MKDFKEEMLNQQEYLEIQKEGAIIILDYYNERLKNIADNGIEPTGHLMRIEIQERGFKIHSLKTITYSWYQEWHQLQRLPSSSWRN